MDLPLPEVTELNRPYWDGLTRGVLHAQRCNSCGNAWLPARHECPRCLSADAVWEAVDGGGHVVSWVVYHVAYHDAFRDRLPYNVAVVELDEGVRLITNIVAPEAALSIGLRVHLRLEEDFGLCLPRFVPA
ncbi:Zn-ribbon domain-containing OB-fold protein [Roseomonas marmotae]|uniref:OB-fold domain-containing protein n=1 Tax=Roseomonas marmotae TaxID=2768161 RepID=A0ABS3KHI1_9PROT|nr:OB-fold domain-containing protein [Roseomonas marmotae]MBO1076934.1 OB-fold domain-containing protein [Roseomonas marmotae]QTI82075.1 OB-fold domain-containing protein [Roseomonas marmotae]